MNKQIVFAITCVVSSLSAGTASASPDLSTDKAVVSYYCELVRDQSLSARRTMRAIERKMLATPDRQTCRNRSELAWLAEYRASVAAQRQEVLTEDDQVLCPPGTRLKVSLQ